MISNGVKLKITSIFVFSSLMFFVVSGILPVGATAAKNAAPAAKEPGEIIVKFKGSDELVTINIEDEADYSDILASYNRNPLVEYAEPNYKYDAALMPTDTYFYNQWYLDKIKAVKAWDSVRESPNVIIAVLDTGVEIDHPDLKDNIWTNTKEIPDNRTDDDNDGYVDDMHGWDFVNSSADPAPKFKTGFTEDGIMHGTIVAGVAAASGNNAAGIAGVTWRAQIMPLKVLDDTGEGNTINVIKGIDYAINNGANIINFSFVGLGYSKSLDDAIRRAYNAGIIIVAAAGNEQSDGTVYSLDTTPMYPACYDGLPGENMVIGVAATDPLDQKTAFSSYGTRCVDIAAPGVSIYSTAVYAPTKRIGDKSFNNYYDGFWSGTSMATPMVSGAFALVLAANGGLTRSQAVGAILNNADNIDKLNPDYINKLGKGRLNIQAAVNAVKSTLSDRVTKILVGPYSKYKSQVKITDTNGTLSGTASLAYSDAFRGGVNVASGDLNGDGTTYIVTAPTQGNSPQVKIFDINMKPVGQFYAFGSAFRGGVSLAVGDVNGDGADEIVVGAGPGGGPHIRIFNKKGQVLGQFFAFSTTFHGGVNVAVGDVDGNGTSEIVAGGGNGGGPQVRIFTARGALVGQFFAYDSKFRGGVRVAVGEVSGAAGGNKAEIITAPGPGGGPQVRIFNNKGQSIGQFFAYASNFRGGINVAAGDTDNDGVEEIITGAGPGGAPHVRVFRASGELLGSFYAFDSTMSGGVTVAPLTAYKSYFDTMKSAALPETAITTDIKNN